MGMKFKASFTKKKGIALWIMYFIFWILGYFCGKSDTQGDLLSYIIFFILIAILIWNVGNKDKEKKK